MKRSNSYLNICVCALLVLVRQSAVSQTTINAAFDQTEVTRNPYAASYPWPNWTWTGAGAGQLTTEYPQANADLPGESTYLRGWNWAQFRVSGHATVEPAPVNPATKMVWAKVKVNQHSDVVRLGVSMPSGPPSFGRAWMQVWHKRPLGSDAANPLYYWIDRIYDSDSVDGLASGYVYKVVRMPYAGNNPEVHYGGAFLLTSPSFAVEGYALRYFDGHGSIPLSASLYHTDWFFESVVSATKLTIIRPTPPTFGQGGAPYANWAAKANIKLLTPGTSTVVDEYDIDATATGELDAVCFDSSSYDVYLTMPRCVSKRFNYGIVDGESTISGSYVLPNGDINGDNTIGTDDYLILSDAFDSDDTQDGWAVPIDGGFAPSDADLNYDGFVNTDDYDILSTYFDSVGDSM